MVSAAAVMFLLVWNIIGIVAFIMSLVCFGYEGETSLKIVGLFLALFLGPIYWIFFFAASATYCVKRPVSVPVPVPPPPV